METFVGSIVVNDGGGAWVELREVFDGLSFSHRREHVNAINDAKKPETRIRRISRALEMLKPA